MQMFNTMLLILDVELYIHLQMKKQAVRHNMLLICGAGKNIPHSNYTI